jgi:exodeoxyribonuclease-3
VKLISWNVNGLRAVLKRNFREFLEAEKPDILCLQETKLSEIITDAAWEERYSAYWNLAEKKGYSGTAILSATKPLNVTYGIGIGEHDREGRVLTAEFADFFVVNVYVPNSKRDLSRLEYRQRWDHDFLAYLKKLEAHKPVITCGDFNVAHTPLDLARPKGNEKTHGFTPEERAGFDTFIRSGLLDTFRIFETGGGHYSWWSQMSGARARDIGWRIDYFLASESLRPKISRAWILKDVLGSDHCPVGLEVS